MSTTCLVLLGDDGFDLRIWRRQSVLSSLCVSLMGLQDRNRRRVADGDGQERQHCPARHRRNGCTTAGNDVLWKVESFLLGGGRLRR